MLWEPESSNWNWLGLELDAPWERVWERECIQQLEQEIEMLVE